MKRRDFTFGGLGLLGLAGQAAAQDAAPAAFDPIPALLAETKAPALGGMVLTAGSTLWLGAAGRRRATQPGAVSQDDRWHLGSNTKAMTAALYAKLVEQGRARWGATVPELFPGLKLDAAWKAVTIEALMSHRAGLTDAGLIDGAWLTAARSDPRPLREQRRAFAAKAFGAPPKGAPGAFQYANANFIVAGAAIERIVGADWEAAITDGLFQPLGMTEVGFGAPKGEEPWGHMRDGTPVDPSGISDNPAALGPAGTVNASLEHYARFIRLFISEGGGFLSADSIARLTAPAGPEEPSYGLGWGVFRQRGWARGPALAHEGSNTLWHAVALVAPARGLAVITVSNDDARGGKAAQALAQALIKQFAPA